MQLFLAKKKDKNQQLVIFGGPSCEKNRLLFSEMRCSNEPSSGTTQVESCVLSHVDPCQPDYFRSENNPI